MVHAILIARMREAGAVSAVAAVGAIGAVDHVRGVGDADAARAWTEHQSLLLFAEMVVRGGG